MLGLGWGVRSGSPVTREDPANRELQVPPLGQALVLVQPGWLMQEQGTLALCPGCCWVSFLPEWQWLQAAPIPGWLEPWGNHSHTISLLDSLSFLGFTAGWADSWLAFSSSSCLFHPSRLKSKPWTLFVCTGLWKRTVIKINLYSWAEYQNLSSEGTMYSLAPKATWMGG